MDRIADLSVFYLLQSPLFWLALIIISFYLIERLYFGIHCLEWTSRRTRHLSYCNGIAGFYKSEIDGTSELQQTADSVSHGRNVEHCNGHVLQNDDMPTVFHNFIQKRLIPAFHSQCQQGDHKFAVLALSNISRVDDIENVKFRQITFNGVPLVDSSRAMYPQPYRYENYIVARPDGSVHPEAMIMAQVPALVKAYKLKERCYIRCRKPKFGILYCWTMPCSTCTKLIIQSLSGVCSVRVVVAYTQRNETEKDHVIHKNRQMLTSAGFAVVKVDAGK